MPSSILNSDDGVISGTSGLKSSGGDDGVLVFQSKGTETARINTDKQIVAAAGTASLPALTTTGDVNTGIFFPAADTIAFAEGGAEAMRIDSNGNVGIGTSSPASSTTRLTVYDNTNGGILFLGRDAGEQRGILSFGRLNSGSQQTAARIVGNSDNASGNNGTMTFWTANSSATITERMRIDSSGNLLVGTTNPNVHTSSTDSGFVAKALGEVVMARDSGAPFSVNRLSNDGELVRFYQAGTQEGNISVSGTTVSYNGGHLSRWTQTTTAKDESLKKGTVMSNLDEMNVYVDADGNPVENEQLNKVKVSDVEGDANVAGVFVNWSYDEAHSVDEINMAMTGDMIIRIAQGTTVARGDLLMSAGDGTAKPQGDDIVRSKTIAKVTSTHVTCTYDDGSYCVPCVLMAC